MLILEAGMLYFGVVFGVGFVLGAIRTLWIVPRIGNRKAELGELPFMIAVSFLAARYVVARLAIPPTPQPRLELGGVALALMLAAEFGLMLKLRRISLKEYFAERDPVSGTAYYLALLLFAILPLLLAGVH